MWWSNDRKMRVSGAGPKYGAVERWVVAAVGLCSSMVELDGELLLLAWQMKQ